MSEHNKRIKTKRKKDSVGVILIFLQLVLSLILLVVVYGFGMFPFKYIMVGAMVLLCLWLIYILAHIRRKHRGVLAKIFCVLMCGCMCLGIFYIGKTNNVLGQISKDGFQTSKIVVAVRSDDQAQSIQDTASYNFGVQFAEGGENMGKTLDAIKEELGEDISTIQYDDLTSQTQALCDGEIEAIIYDYSYSNTVEQCAENNGQQIRIIYSQQFKTDIVSTEGEDNTLLEKPFAVYISGLDVYEDTNESEGQRSDVNIIAVVNPKTCQILLVTTPRDYYVTIPGVSEGMYDKLTHAGSYGVDVSMNTLSELYETPIQYYVQLNFTSLINIVDILGGIDVESEYSFTTSEDSGYVMDVQEGMNHFNGVEALAFARERQNVEGGDFQRGRDQQAVITAIMKKMLSPLMLLKANNILESVGENMWMNVTRAQINSVIKNQLDKNPTWYLQSVSADGEPGEDTCYSAGGEYLSVVYPDEDSVQQIIELVNVVENGEVLEEANPVN